MRKALIQYLIDTDNPNRYFLTADVGFGVLDELKAKMGDRFINVGIAEQLMIGIASGLALSGKQVFTFTMCAFYLRALEQIRNDLCYQNVPVTMIGVGTGYEYGNLGTTHYATEDEDIMLRLRNMRVITLENEESIPTVFKALGQYPTYLRVPGKEHQDKGGIFTNTNTYPKFGGSINFMQENNEK